MIRVPYRAVYDYRDGRIFRDVPTTKRLARAKATLWKRLDHHEEKKGIITIEKLKSDEWQVTE